MHIGKPRHQGKKITLLFSWLNLRNNETTRSWLKFQTYFLPIFLVINDSLPTLFSGWRHLNGRRYQISHFQSCNRACVSEIELQTNLLIIRFNRTRRSGPINTTLTHTVCFNISKRSWWRHQMETFSALRAGNSPVTGEFPSQRPVTRSFDVFFFIWTWTNVWVNNREAVDLRRYRGHYDVTVMYCMENNSDLCSW